MPASSTVGWAAPPHRQLRGVVWRVHQYWGARRLRGDRRPACLYWSFIDEPAAKEQRQALPHWDFEALPRTRRAATLLNERDRALDGSRADSPYLCLRPVERINIVSWDGYANYLWEKHEREAEDKQAFDRRLLEWVDINARLTALGLATAEPVEIAHRAAVPLETVKALINLAQAAAEK
ncbi:hypothetical protein OHA61_33050 [Streptomyces sp. NBC_00885]|uniref:hypothetical protein n=1 Tax=Streptomyces sp. NBC_00885 TaxID=2975857 RepID=UPI00386A9828|nr:hypothetical protein OHA61_33050 [Streptomyces sp. NBC_00885]